MRSKRAGPPDGGYGWVVVISAFLITGLSSGIVRNIGLFFLDIQHHFGVLTSTTSWVIAITIATFHLGAPVASALSLRFSQRVVIMVGGLLAASGMILAFLDLSVYWLFLSIGFLQGLGVSFSWISANISVNRYFLRWRPIAFAIANSGECVFAAVFSYFIQWLIDAYTWQGALLVIGGIQLNICVCGALMRPLETVPNPIRETEDGLDGETFVVAPKKKVVFQCSLLRKPEFLLYILFASFSVAGMFIPPLFLVPLAKSLRIEEYWAASLLSALAAADLVGRLIGGWIANMRLLRNLQLLTIVVALAGAMLLLLPISYNYWTLLVFFSLYSFLFGCMVAVQITSIVDVVGPEGFDSGLGLVMLLRSIGSFVGPPAAGWLVDHTGHYGSAFYMAGLCFVSSGAFALLADRLVEKRKAPGSDAVEAAADPGGQEVQTGGQPLLLPPPPPSQLRPCYKTFVFPT